jgi:hypothetical protein
MSLSELLAAEKIDLNDKEKIALLQKFYQEGYCQGVKDKYPNYEYSLKYSKIVKRILMLFRLTTNPIELEDLEKSLDAMDEYRKEHGIYIGR